MNASCQTQKVRPVGSSLWISLTSSSFPSWSQDVTNNCIEGFNVEHKVFFAIRTSDPTFRNTGPPSRGKIASCCSTLSPYSDLGGIAVDQIVTRLRSLNVKKSRKQIRKWATEMKFSSPSARAEHKFRSLELFLGAVWIYREKKSVKKQDAADRAAYRVIVLFCIIFSLRRLLLMPP